ncbi:2-methylcitrate dehydratase [Hymenopellis radicata]|nr:2-methylcitrate dehydratase [Hymenopellis radicata]
MSSHSGESTLRPEPDKVLQDIADYVHNFQVDPTGLAMKTASLCLIDTIGCGLEGLRFPECTKLLGPVVEGTIVPNGTRVPGTNYQLDPIRGAFNIGTIIRWLDFNDCFLAAECGGLALLNSFNRAGLDHVVLVKVASTAVVSKMLGLNRDQTIDAISQAWVDGQSLRTYRHAPNTGPRKSWAAGDACSRAVNLALLVKKGEKGLPSVLTAKTWGFYDVLFKASRRRSVFNLSLNKIPPLGQTFRVPIPYSSYIMENVLFKISYPAEFHAQTAVECAYIVHAKLKEMGKTAEDIKSVRIRTQEAAVRIIDKKGPLDNFADRDHAINYMVAYPLIFGELTSDSYTDASAADPRIDALREKIYSLDRQRSLVELNDGTVLEEVEVEYPVGHKRRREEGTPLLLNKFKRHISHHFEAEHQKKILDIVTGDSAKFGTCPSTSSLIFLLNHEI